MKNYQKDPDPQSKPLSFSEELAKAVINSLSAPIAILDPNGVILDTNRAWNDYSFKNGMPEDFDYRGINYLEVCDAATGADALDALISQKGFGRLFKAIPRSFYLIIPVILRIVNIGTICGPSECLIRNPSGRSLAMKI